MGIPPLPIVQPIQKPLASPGEMRHAGLDAALDVNRGAEQIASIGMQVEDRIIQAKRQLDVKQGEIAFDKYQEQTEADLAKTVSVEDVDALHENYQNGAPEVVTPYSKDPRVAQALNLYAQSRSVDMERTVNARKAKIITDQDLAANELKGDKSTQDWKNAFLSGEDVSIAEGDEKLTLQSSVLHGTMTQEHADLKFQEWLLKTKQSAIEGIMNSPDPVQRRKFIDQLKSGNMPKELAGLDRGFLNQALTAAQGKDAELKARAEAQDVNAKFNNSLGEFRTHPDLYPSPELKSAAYGNPDFLKAIGAVTPEGQPDFVAGQKLRSLYAPLGADEKTAAKVKVDKEFDDISKLIAENKLGQAQVMLDKYRPDFEALDASFYRAGESAIREQVRFNEQQERFGRQEARWEAEEKGKQSFSRLMKNITDNKPVDFGKDIVPLLISGEITPSQVRSAMAMSAMAQKDRGVQMGLKLIQSAAQFTAGTDETNLQMAELGFAYTDMVQQYGIKGKDAIDLAASMRDEAAKKSVQDAINDAFSWRPGEAPPTQSWWKGLSNLRIMAPPPGASPLPPAPDSKQPKVVERRTTKSGKILEKLDDGSIREAP